MTYNRISTDWKKKTKAVTGQGWGFGSGRRRRGLGSGGQRGIAQQRGLVDLHTVHGDAGGQFVGNLSGRVETLQPPLKPWMRLLHTNPHREKSTGCEAAE